MIMYGSDDGEEWGWPGDISGAQASWPESSVNLGSGLSGLRQAG